MITSRNFYKSILIAFAIMPFFSVAQNIGQRTIKFKDTIRNRPLITEIWYPTADTLKQSDKPAFSPFVRVNTVRNGALPSKKVPLVMISHGTGGGRLTLEWLADALVQQGFMVAAVDHWGNTFDNKIAINFVTPWERPQDISFVLTQLLNDKSFAQVIDSKRIGAAGFSIGGYTVIALAGGKLSYQLLDDYSKTPAGQQEEKLPEFPDLMKVVNWEDVEASFKKSPPLKDSRIKAFFAICPAIGQGFNNGSQFSQVKSPLFLVGAESDSICPIKTNAEHYHQLITGSQYYLVKGKVGHYVFLNEASDVVKKQAPIYFTDDSSVDRHAIQKQVGKMAADFFAKTLK